MSVNTNSLMQGVEVRFSIQSNITHKTYTAFNSNAVRKAPSQLHLRLIIDDKLNFREDINKKLCKGKKSIGILRQITKYLHT